MVSISAVVTDLDGTLLNPDGSLPRRYDVLREELEGHGLSLVVASARPFGNINRLFAGRRPPSGIVACDGAIVAALGDTGIVDCFETRLPFVHASAAFRAMVSARLEPVLFLTRANGFLAVAGLNDDDVLVGLRRSDPTRPVVLAAQIDAEAILEQLPVRAISALAVREVIAVAAQHVAAQLRAFPNVRVYSYDETRFGDSRYAWLDVVERGNRKEDAIQIALRQLRLSERPFIGCGNGENDLGFLRAAAFAFCPATAATTVRNICTTAPAAEGDPFVDWLIERLKGFAPEA